MASPGFAEIYAFGDSLSDSGRIFQVSNQLLSLAVAAGIDTQGLQPFPVSPPYAGKFSNGAVLPEIIADLLDAKLVNFAFGGAEALGTQSLREAAGSAIPAPVLTAIDALSPAERAPIEATLSQNINLPRQLADLIAETSTHHPSADSALLSLIGLDDLRALAETYDADNPFALIGSTLQMAAEIVQANVDFARTALGLGIGTVIFETLPLANFFPASSKLPIEISTFGDAAISVINLGLQTGGSVLRLQGYDVRVVDLARMADDITADPATFGFLSPDQPTLLANGTEFAVNPLAPPIEQTAFFDFVHPTTNLHGVLAAFSALSLTHHNDFRGNDNDFINAGPGEDLILAGTGNDQAWLGDGNDVLLSGLGDDMADGEMGSDLLSGGSGNDRLSGGAGADVLAGNTGDDTLEGGPGDDTLIDGSGNDEILAGAGDDIIFDEAGHLGATTGENDNYHLPDVAYFLRAFGNNSGIRQGGGDDYVDGGEGMDTAHYASPSSHYKLVIDQSTITVLDRVEPDGFDTLVSVERAQFADQTLETTWFTKAASVPAAPFAVLTDMYLAYLDRAPDAVGLFYWASRFSDGMTLQEVARSFFVQPETIAAYAAGQSTTEFVAKVYDNVLGRAPDQPGLDYWIDALQTGDVTKEEFNLAIIHGARAATGSPADARYLANRDLVGKAYAMTEGLSNVAWAKTVMADVDGTAASVQAALQVIDGMATAAAAPGSPELVVQLIGVVV